MPVFARIASSIGLAMLFCCTALAQSSSYPALLNWGNEVTVTGVTYFAASDNDHGIELWRSDGTAEGTWLVADVNPGPNSSYPTDLVVVDGWIYFTADDGQHGTELWRTDGWPQNTAMVADIVPGIQGSNPFFMAGLGSKVYFQATTAAMGELFVIGADGLLNVVQDINPGLPDSFPTELTSTGPLLFFVAEDGAHGRQVWRSDGTSAGTFRVSSVQPASSLVKPFQLQLSQGRVTFRVANGAGAVTWISDGTVEGTLPLGAVQLGSATVSWQPPTTNVDGSPLVGLAGYKVHFGRNPAALSSVVEITDPGARSLEIRNLIPGLNFFAVTAFTEQQLESDLSQRASKIVGTAP